MNSLKNWEKATREITQLFCKKYFDNTRDWYFVSDECEGVLSVGDYFFDLEFIVTAIRYKATAKQVFDYYDKSLKMSTKNKPMPISFRNHVKHGECLLKPKKMYNISRI